MTVIHDRFRDFCNIDLNLSKATTDLYICRVKKVLRHLNKPLKNVSTNDLRSVLKTIKDRYEPETYAGYLKVLRTFFGKFLDRMDLMSTFRFPHIPEKPKMIPSKEEVQILYYALDHDVVKTYYLLVATSGLRRHEALYLLKDNIDLNKRMILPLSHRGRTKRTYVTFFNEETRELLLNIWNTTNSPKVFVISPKTFKREWREAKQITELNITPQVLRDWFCQQMGELGVPDRYIDAFCGRIPKSILARHYTDYSPERLKRIYDKAELKVLS